MVAHSSVSVLEQGRTVERADGIGIGSEPQPSFIRRQAS
jgi:hypothetical protein